MLKFTFITSDKMRHLAVTIPDKKYDFFIELVESLGFVKEVKSIDEPGKEQILSGLRDAVEEVKAIKAGKKKGVPLNDFLNGL